MIKKKLIFTTVFFLIFLYAKNSIGLENKILFKINNDIIITSIDIYNEINYLKAVNKELVKIDEIRIMEIAKNSLINRYIKKKEISKFTDNLFLEDKYLNSYIERVYKNLNFSSLNEFELYIEQYELDIEDIKQKVSLEIIWNDLIFSKFSKSIKIDKEDIKKSLEVNKSKINIEFLLSEIIFQISENSYFEEKTKLIENDIMIKGFKNAALIHSISSSAQTNNGEIGWINENSLNEEIKEQLKKLKIGEHTQPIVIPGGFIILRIDDIKKIEINDSDIDKKVNEIAEKKITEQLNNYSNIYFDKIKKEYKINEK